MSRSGLRWGGRVEASVNMVEVESDNFEPDLLHQQGLGRVELQFPQWQSQSQIRSVLVGASAFDFPGTAPP